MVTNKSQINTKQTDKFRGQQTSYKRNKANPNSSYDTAGFQMTKICVLNMSAIIFLMLVDEPHIEVDKTRRLQMRTNQQQIETNFRNSKLQF